MHLYFHTVLYYNDNSYIAVWQSTQDSQKEHTHAVMTVATFQPGSSASRHRSSCERTPQPWPCWSTWAWLPETCQRLEGDKPGSHSLQLAWEKHYNPHTHMYSPMSSCVHWMKDRVSSPNRFCRLMNPLGPARTWPAGGGSSN